MKLYDTRALQNNKYASSCVRNVSRGVREKEMERKRQRLGERAVASSYTMATDTD